MGCCVSTSTNPLKQQQKGKQQRQHCSSGYGRGCGGKAVPHPLMEEEAVKEVLSETPAVKPLPPPPPPPSSKVEVEHRSNTPPTPKLASKKVEEEEKIVEKKVPVFSVEEISEVSEICSMSESVSTTTVTERRDDDERSRDECEVRQRVARSPARFQNNPRSLSGDLGGRRERKSPARRLEQPSPGKVRSASARDGAHSTAKQTDGRRGQRSGQNGARRSRSPATRADNGAPRSGIGKSPSARKTAQSPSNIPAPAPAAAAAGGSGRNVDQTEKEGKWPPSAAAPATNESLENPLVSLECFIFL